MNILCSSQSDNEFIEAMNTLEQKKQNQNQKNFDYFKEMKEGQNKQNLKKNSSILEIIDYPFIQSSRKLSEIHLHGDSNITNKNGETELMIEYTTKYMNTTNNYINNYNAKLNDNIIKNNKEIDKTKKNSKLEIINKLNNNNKYIKQPQPNNDSLKDLSNDTLIINNDYNSSIISQINNFNGSNINSKLLNFSKSTNKLYKSVNNNNNLVKLKEDSFKNSCYLPNKSKNEKKSYSRQNI